MFLKTNLVAMQFFSHTNQVSLNTRKALDKALKKGLQGYNLKVQEVDYDSEKEVCKQYGVRGVPVTLVFWKDKLIGRHYGEITSEEFQAIFRHYFDARGDDQKSNQD